MKEWADLEPCCKRELEQKIKFIENDASLKSYVETVIISHVLEAGECESAVAKLVSQHAGLFDATTSDEAKSNLEVLREIVAATLKGYVDKKKQLDNSEDLICRVENLMLMYGGGHLLLKDTVFELRKGQRYGVVGRNGAGKTTLMNMIATGQVSAIPAHMKCVHVKPEVLQAFLEIKCVDWIQSEHKKATKAEVEASLTSVQFPKEMWTVTIGELSGGWRMRVLIANAMMKKAEILLL